MSLRVLSVTLALIVAACGSKTEPTPNPAPAQVEPTKAEPAKAEAAEPAKAEAAEPAKADAAEPAKAELAEPAKPEVQAPPIPEPTGLFACKAKADAPPTTSDKADIWALPYDVQGCPAIPSVFGQVTIGMTREEVAAAIGKDGKVSDSGSAYIYLGKHPHKLQLSIRFSEAGKVDKLVHKIDAKAFDLLKSAWGEPLLVKDGTDVTYSWFNPETGIRAHAEPTEWDRQNAAKEDEKVEGYQLYFGQYTPLASALGADGLLSKDLIGKTAPELAQLFPDAVEQKTAEEAKAELDKLGLDADTMAKAEALGVGGASTDLSLPPTETREHTLFVQPNWAGGKVENYSTNLDFGADQALKTEILAVVASVLGKPTAVEKDGDKFEYTFAGPNGQVVNLEPNTLDDGWRLRVSKP